METGISEIRNPKSEILNKRGNRKKRREHGGKQGIEPCIRRAGCGAVVLGYLSAIAALGSPAAEAWISASRLDASSCAGIVPSSVCFPPVFKHFSAFVSDLELRISDFLTFWPLPYTGMSVFWYNMRMINKECL